MEKSLHPAARVGYDVATVGGYEDRKQYTIVKRNARGLRNAAAGMQRNECLALRAIEEARSRLCAAGLLLIWDGTSSGSANMRRVALRHRLQLFEYIPPANA